MEAARGEAAVIDLRTGEVIQRECWCETCGQLIDRRYPSGSPIYPSRYAKRRFCSLACVRPGHVRTGPRTANPTSNGGRQRAQNAVPLRPCDRCGSAGCDRHHIDGDTANNDLSNITVLCRRCHMEVDGRLASLVAIRKQRASSPAKPCVNCGRLFKPLRNGRCGRCDSWFRRLGRERPPEFRDGRTR